MAGRARWLILLPALLVAWGAPRRAPEPDAEGAEARFVLRPELAKLAALGFEAVVGDYHWLRAVQIVGGSRRDPSVHGPVLGRLVDVATTLDPWVDHPYRFAALWMTTDAETVREANRLLERGIAYHPREWRNRFYLSFNHFYYLGELEPAAEILESAVDLPGAPRYLGRLAARLRAVTAENADGLDVAEAYLRELLRDAPDGYARAEYEKALDAIETERRARFLDRARELYRQRNGRDIERVKDLVEGPGAVLTALPPELHGWEWVIDEETGRVVSSYYGHRYEPYLPEGGYFAERAGAGGHSSAKRKDRRG